MRSEHWNFDCAYLHLYDVVSDIHTQQTTSEKPDKLPISMHVMR
jgi:hypothetical protein